MRRSILAGGLLALIAFSAGAPAEVDVGTPAATTQPRLYGAHWDGSLNLVRVDRNTLRPLPGRRVPLDGEPLGWSFAPDRSRMALGSTARGAKLRLVDLRAMRSLGDVRITRRGSGIATAWTGRRRLLALVVTPGCCGTGDTIVAGVDSVRRQVAWRRTLGGSLQAGAQLRDGFVLVLGPRGRSIGPSRIVRVGPDGSVRSAPLAEIRSGTESSAGAAESWNPGLAVDGSGDHAYVVQAGAPVAEVDLATLEVRSHQLEAQARSADAVRGPTRHALWLGRGLLAITGSDSRPSGAETPAGLTLVDTRSWSSRTIDARASNAALAGGTLLASSFLFDPRSQSAAGSGLTGYSIDGRRRFHRYGDAPITGVQPLGRRALVGAENAINLIDARTGRRLRGYRRFAMSLFSADAPVF